jgi:hypothetical protein
VKGNFEQEKIISRLNRSLVSSGNFIITAQLGMVWETLKPFPSTMVLGKDYLVQFRPAGQKTVLSAQGNETFTGMAEVLSAVFSGNSRGLLDNFEIYFNGGGSNWEMALVPLEKAIASFAAKILMKGDMSLQATALAAQQAAAIKSIVIYEQNGDSITYALSNHSYPAELSAAEKNLFLVP